MHHKTKPTHVSDYQTTRKIRKTIDVEVLFGLASKNCAGSGICRVEALNAWEQCMLVGSKCQKARGKLIMSRPQTVKLYLPINSICKRKYNTMFAGQELVVKEAFRIPWEVKERWRLPTDYVFPGSYPLTRTEEFLIVKFGFQEKKV